MADKKKQKQPTNRTTPRLLKGFRDLAPEDILYRNRMLETIRTVYERYGFQPLETPALEYVDALGKFLPESETPEGGIFAFRFEDEEWVALRYDLTAPLSRYVALNRNTLPLPYRRYQYGPVYRLEKPDPGRYREFFQCDFDIVGAPLLAADAEVCMVLADAMEALGLARGNYLIRVNNRKLLNGLIELLGLPDPAADRSTDEVPLRILRAMDKLDKVGLDGVRHLLGKGRQDESGAFTPGAGLSDTQVERVIRFLETGQADRAGFCDRLGAMMEPSAIGCQGLEELREIHAHLTAAGYADDRVTFDTTVVRGLGYYTGPVVEVGLTFETPGDGPEVSRFGSVGGGGRYDTLIERFTGEQIPATGASIGVDRLLQALKTLGLTGAETGVCPVLVTVMDKNRLPDYQAIARELRAAGIPTELYLGGRNFKQQMKYADARNARIAVIAGGNEFDNGEVALKDLTLGRAVSEDYGEDREKWREERPAQVTVRREDLAGKVREMLDPLPNSQGLP
jgi:histidyl-tRNA synthetase